MKGAVSGMCLAASISMTGAAAVYAQNYPVRPVRFIINFPPGGGTDIMGRLAADGLARAWGVQVLADNRPGAGGNIGMELCARAAPDGYTLCMFTAAQSIAPSIYPKITYDPLMDFAYVTMLATLPSLLLVHPSVPARNVEELVLLARSRPGALTYASTGNGSSPHMLMEMFKMFAKIDMIHIPYKGATPAVIDHIAGQVQVGFNNAIAVMSYVQSGKIRALAISTADRLLSLPDLPTMEQAGIRGFEGGGWNAVVMPASSPRDIVAKVQGDLAKLMRTPETKEKVAAMGGIPIGNSPEEFSAYLKADMARWSQVAKAAKVRVE